MGLENTRRSDRIAIELRIVVSGTDAIGHTFMEEAQTLVITRHGAKIALNRKLVPDLELCVRCLGSGREADVRVVGQIGEGPEGQYYGVEIIDPDIDLWGIEFPPPTNSERAVGRVLLECVRCHTRELAYLNEFEAEVFEANQLLSRSCKRCRDMSLWRLSAAKAPSEELPPEYEMLPRRPLPPPVRTKNERKQVRIGLQMKACIRSAEFGEDIVTTGDVSRGGFSFKSSRRYEVGNVVEACLPYSPGAGNIFAPARIAHAKALPEEGVYLYGAAYVPVRKGRAVGSV